MIEKYNNGAEYTQLTFGKLIVQEPMTAFTNFLVAAVCFYFYFKLKKHYIKQGVNKSIKLKTIFFLLFGVATTVAGFAHGFYYKFGMGLHKLGWALVVSSLATLTCGFIMSIKKHQKLILRGYLFITLIYLLVLPMAKSFGAITGFLAFSLVAVVLPTLVKENQKEHYKKYMLYSIGMFALTGLVFATKLTISKWFNFNDLAHIVELIGIVFIYYSVKAEQLKEV